MPGLVSKDFRRFVVRRRALNQHILRTGGAVFSALNVIVVVVRPKTQLQFRRIWKSIAVGMT